MVNEQFIISVPLDGYRSAEDKKKKKSYLNEIRNEIIYRIKLKCLKSIMQV